MNVSFASEDLEPDLRRFESRMHIETLAPDSRAASPRISIDDGDGDDEENNSVRNDEPLMKGVAKSPRIRKVKKRKQRRSKITEEDTDPDILDYDTLPIDAANTIENGADGSQNQLGDDSELNLSSSDLILDKEKTNKQESEIVEESVLESGVDGIVGSEPTNEFNQSMSSLRNISSSRPRLSHQHERLKSFVQQSMQDRFNTLSAGKSKSFALEKTAEMKDFSHLLLRASPMNHSDSSRMFFKDFKSQSRISRLPTFSSLSFANTAIANSSSTQSKAPPSHDDLFVSSASSMTVEVLKKKIKHIRAEQSVDGTSSKDIVANEISSDFYKGSLQSLVSQLQKSGQSVHSRDNDKIGSEVKSEHRDKIENWNSEQIVGKIVDDEEYDLIVTYKLPKSAPFDPEDKLEDVRIKCIENWMNDRGNALYKSTFEDEIETKAEQKSVEKLIAKLVVLMRKIKKCDVCQKPPSISEHSVVAPSYSTFSLVESSSFEKLEDGETSEKSSTPESVFGEHEDLFATLKEEIDLLGNKMENAFKPKASRDLKSRGDSYSSVEVEIDSLDLDTEDVEETIVDTTAKRMRFIRCQLERMICDLEKNIEEEKPEVTSAQPDEEQQSAIIGVPRFKICECDDPWLNGLAESLISHFKPRKTGLLRQADSTSILPEKTAPRTREIEIEEPEQVDEIQRIQMYLLGLTDSWLSQDLTDVTRHKSPTVDGNKENISVNLGKDQNQMFCKCGCDRVSRFNVKQRQHFRPVVDENLDCYNVSKISPNEDLGGALKKQDKFKGWLADTDRNLLLMMNRSFGDLLDITKNRRSVENYGKKTQSTHELPNDENLSRADMIREVLTDAGKREAEQFWDFVGQTYANYRANDKLRRLIDEFEKVDYLSMLKRDLALLKEQMKLRFDEAKASAQLRIEERLKQRYEIAVQKLQESLECQGHQRLIAKRIELDQRKEFQILKLRLEAEERYKLKFREFKKSCIDILKWKNSKEHPMITAHREANEIVTTVDQIDAGEKLRTRILGSVGVEHEELEKAQGKAIKMRNQSIENLKETIVKLNRDIVIWKSAVGEVLISHRKFVQYVLETRPDKAQYVLNLERIYQLKMDGLIEDVQNELKNKQKDLKEKETERREKLLQPAFEIKCPSHKIRYSSGTTTVIGSSSDTDVEQDVRARKIVGHAVDYAIRAALPSSELSYIGEEASEMKEQDPIGFLSSETSFSQVEKDSETVEKDESSVCDQPIAVSGRKKTMVIVGDGASGTSIHLDEFTRRRVQDMLGVISRKTPQIKTQLQL